MTIIRINIKKIRWIRMSNTGGSPMTDLAYVLPVEDVWGEYGTGTAQEQEGYEESESCLFRFLW